MSQNSNESKRLAAFGFHKTRSALLLLLIILVGFALRIHDLDGQSMWTDEGLSLYRSGQPVTDIVRNVITVDGIDTRDTNPALYFLLLHLWRQLSGDTITAMRYLGVVMAVLSVPLIYALGKLSFSRRAGIVAAFLMAISPFHIWQSQILRNYSLLMSLNLLSVYGLMRFILAGPKQRRTRWLLVWLVAGLLGIYSHYFGFFIFAFGLITLAVFAVNRVGIKLLMRQRWLWLGLGLSLLVVIPASFVAFDRFRAGQQMDFFFVPVPTVVHRALSAFAVGMEPSLVHSWWLILPALILAGVGTWFGWWSRRRATLLLLGYQFIPIGLLLILSLINPLYNGTRHLLIGLPPFLLLVAEGIAGPGLVSGPGITQRWWFRRLWHWGALILGLLVVLVQLSWLYTQFNSPRLVRDDVRGAAQYLSHHAGPDDVVILHDTLIRFTFDYYYDGPAPVVAVPAYNQRNVDAATEELTDLVRDKERIWFLNTPTPRNGFDREALLTWTASNWLPAVERDFPDMWLRTSVRGFLPKPDDSTEQEEVTPLDVAWDNGLLMSGFKMPERLNAGYPVLFTFNLSDANNDDSEYIIALQLADDQGLVWATLENDPLAGPGSGLITDEHYLFDVPSGLPPGTYTVLLQLLDRDTRESMLTSAGQPEVVLGKVMAQSAYCGVDDEYLPDNIRTAKTRGEDVELRGFLPFESEVEPDSTLTFDLFWCVHNTPQEELRLRLELINQDGQVVAESKESLAGLDYPMTAWQPGELLATRTNLYIPAGTEAGPHELRLSLLPAGTGRSFPVTWFLDRNLLIGQLEVLPPYLRTGLPDIQSPLQADILQPPIIEFHGYSLSADQVAPGDSVELSLIWRSLREEKNSSYVIVVSVVDEAGQILLEKGSIPGGGEGSTTDWQAGDVIVDQHRIMIPTDTTPGEYQLMISLNDPDSGLTLPILSKGEIQEGNRLALTPLSISISP